MSILYKTLGEARSFTATVAAPPDSVCNGHRNLMVELAVPRELSTAEVTDLAQALARVADELHREAGGRGLRLAALHVLTPPTAMKSPSGDVVRLRLADRNGRGSPKRFRTVAESLEEACWRLLHQRRRELIRRKYHAGGLTPQEAVELEHLQEAWTRKQEPRDLERLDSIQRLVGDAERSLRRRGQEGR